jgi:hypothetical protein
MISWLLFLFGYSVLRREPGDKLDVMISRVTKPHVPGTEASPYWQDHAAIGKDND